MADITRVVEGLNEISGYDCQQMSLFDNDVFIRGMAQEAADLLKSQHEEIERLKEQQPKWIPVGERLPENAQHKGALCPRYRVYTKWGETQGWYNPDKECWFILVWVLYDGLIDFKRGDKPCVYREMPGAKVVTHWMPLSEPPKEGGKE